MDFQTANKYLYEGYLYTLILIIASVVLVMALIIGLVIATPQVLYIPEFPGFPNISSSASAFAGLGAVLFAIIVLIVVYLVIFFRYIFRGYMALHRLGIKWAWWLAWGPIIVGIIALALLGSVAAIAASPPRLVQPVGIGGMLIGLAVVAVVLAAFGIFVSVAHILFLDNMHEYTNISLFRTAFILYIISLVLSFIPYVSIVDGILFLVEYIIEMLAYREASRWTPPSPQQPPS